MKEYFQQNFLQGILTSPHKAPLKSWALVPIYCLIAVTVGLKSSVLELTPLNSQLAPLMPFILFVFPSFLEEAFFRGLLIPRNVLDGGPKKATRAVLISTVLFTLWHPANALAYNYTAIPFFTNPWFLVIVFVLGLTCGYSYVQSRSIWVPTIIHWMTVLSWVFIFGGHNLALEI